MRITTKAPSGPLSPPPIMGDNKHWEGDTTLNTCLAGPKAHSWPKSLSDTTTNLRKTPYRKQEVRLFLSVQRESHGYLLPSCFLASSSLHCIPAFPSKSTPKSLASSWLLSTSSSTCFLSACSFTHHSFNKHCSCLFLRPLLFLAHKNELHAELYLSLLFIKIKALC